jgi:hypothetical protein
VTVLEEAQIRQAELPHAQRTNSQRTNSATGALANGAFHLCHGRADFAWLWNEALGWFSYREGLYGLERCCCAVCSLLECSACVFVERIKEVDVRGPPEEKNSNEECFTGWQNDNELEYGLTHFAGCVICDTHLAQEARLTKLLSFKTRIS